VLSARERKGHALRLVGLKHNLSREGIHEGRGHGYQLEHAIDSRCECDSNASKHVLSARERKGDALRLFGLKLNLNKKKIQEGGAWVSVRTRHLLRG